ncbi:MAG: 50S ribosomal protein L13 [Gemmatimonadetes bacterium]|nr:50S ribosomal protein L13 [Gemmatimonadota bacterium]
MPTRERTSAGADTTWHTVDADGRVLGRLATSVATVLRGKHRPDFAPNVEGDHVIVVNAAKVKLTGRKLEQKFHRYHTGYPGGLKEIQYTKLLGEHPERVVEYAVWGMLPKNKLGRKLRKNLRVYAGPEHPHVAQRPQPLAEYVRGSNAEPERGENG